MKEMKYHEIVKANRLLAGELQDEPIRIGVLSNIMVHQIKEILEFALRSEGISAEITLGDYDNIVQESMRLNDNRVFVVFWETANLVDGFQYKAETMSAGDRDALVAKVKSEIDYLINNLAGSSLILFNKFSTLAFDHSFIQRASFDDVAEQLNSYLLERAKTEHKIIIIDIDRVLARVSIEGSIDYRYYYSSKVLYKIDFFKDYAAYIRPVIKSALGFKKKLMAMDCDNTLWKGILGEDGAEGIKFSAESPEGAAFEEVQHLLLALKNKGVLLGICSKNNESDVNEILGKESGSFIRFSDLAACKINWQDKVSNLREMADELNIGIDSFVFVDDSDFEINLVKQNLPEILSLQVPGQIWNYPLLIRENMDQFFNMELTEEDMQRTLYYQQDSRRDEHKSSFDSMDDYLKSLSLRVEANVGDDSLIPRVAQMSQKTNQFNLTTKRYTVADIERFIFNEGQMVIAFKVSDNFGDYGVTGMAIVLIDRENRRAEIDSLLMSCRIIGRNIEYSIMDYIIALLKRNGVDTVSARYIKTLKNGQVEDFYERCGFNLVSSDGEIKEYTLAISEYKPFNYSYLEVK